MAWYDASLWDWGTIAKSAIGAGVGTALVQGAIGLWRDHRKNTSHGAYLAMRLAVLFEAYATECGQFILDNGSAYQGPDEEHPHWDTTLPTLPVLPEDAEGWRSVDRELADRSLSIPNRIAGAQSMIRETIDLDTDRVGTELNRYSAELGSEAWALAAAFRKRYKLNQAKVVWDPSEALARAAASVERADQAREEARNRPRRPRGGEAAAVTPPPPQQTD